MHRNHLLTAATITIAALLAACGDDQTPSADTVPSASSAPSVPTEPVPDESAPVTAADTIPADTTGADTTGADTVPADSTAPDTTAPAATTAPPPAEPAEPGDATVEEYTPATNFVRLDGDRTAAIVEPLADGVYFATDYSVDEGSVVFSLIQYFLCDSTTNVPEHPTIVCASGFGTLDEPTVDVVLAPDATVTIATGDLDALTFAEVSAAEFTRLVDGDTPSADAPADFAFSAQPVFVELVDGAAVDASQIYQS